MIVKYDLLTPQSHMSSHRHQTAPTHTVNTPKYLLGIRFIRKCRIASLAAPCALPARPAAARASARNPGTGASLGSVSSVLSTRLDYSSSTSSSSSSSSCSRIDGPDGSSSKNSRSRISCNHTWRRLQPRVAEAAALQPQPTWQALQAYEPMRRGGSIAAVHAHDCYCMHM